MRENFEYFHKRQISRSKFLLKIFLVFGRHDPEHCGNRHRNSQHQGRFIWSRGSVVNGGICHGVRIPFQTRIHIVRFCIEVVRIAIGSRTE